MMKKTLFFSGVSLFLTHSLLPNVYTYQSLPAKAELTGKVSEMMGLNADPYEIKRRFLSQGRDCSVDVIEGAPKNIGTIYDIDCGGGFSFSIVEGKNSCTSLKKYADEK